MTFNFEPIDFDKSDTTLTNDFVHAIFVNDNPQAKVREIIHLVLAMSYARRYALTEIANILDLEIGE